MANAVAISNLVNTVSVSWLGGGALSASGGVLTLSAGITSFVTNGTFTATSILSAVLDSNAATDTLIKRNGTTGITLGAASLVTLAGNVNVGGSGKNITLGPNSASTTPAYLFAQEYSTTAGWPSFVGNWGSSGVWGIGPATQNADNTLKIGQMSSSGAGVWNASNTIIFQTSRLSLTGVDVATAINTGALAGIGFGFSGTSGGASFVGGTMTGSGFIANGGSYSTTAGNNLVFATASSGVAATISSSTNNWGIGGSALSDTRLTLLSSTSDSASFVLITRPVANTPNYLAVRGDGLVTSSGIVSVTNATEATTGGAGSGTFAGGAYVTKRIIGATEIINAGGQGWGVTSTATAGGTTVLSGTTPAIQIFTGSTTQAVTLPAANVYGAGYACVVIIKNRSSGSVTLNRAGSDLIDGATSFTVTSMSSVTLCSDGSAAWELC